MGSGWTRLTVCGLAAAGLFAFSVDAAAQPRPGRPGVSAGPRLSDAQKKDKAKKAYKEAEIRLASKDYVGALALYQEADATVPNARPKYKIAVCQDRLGNVAAAVDAYRIFLGDGPDPDKLRDSIADASLRLDVLKKTPGQVHVVTDPPGLAGTSVLVDGVLQGAATVNVAPGRHRFSAGATGYDPASVDLDVSYGDKREVKIPLHNSARPVIALVAPPPVLGTNPPPRQAPPPPPQPSRPSMAPAYVTLGLTGAAVVVGTIFGVSALGAKSDFKAQPTTANADKESQAAVLSDVSFIGAGAFGLASVFLLIRGNSGASAAPSVGEAETTQPKSALRPTLVPYATPTGGGASAAFRF